MNKLKLPSKETLTNMGAAGLIALIVALLAHFYLPGAPADDDIIELGVTNFGAIELDGPDPGDGNLTMTGDLSVGGVITYAGGLNPLGVAGDLQLVHGTTEITGTLAITPGMHNLSGMTWGLCSMGQDVDSSAGEPSACTMNIDDNTVTIKTWQSDLNTAATLPGIVHWIIIGQPAE